MNARAIQTGANTQTIRQNFIDAEVAKVGNMEALEAKYSLDEGAISAWVDGIFEHGMEDFLADASTADSPKEQHDIRGYVDQARKAVKVLSRAFKTTLCSTCGRPANRLSCDCPRTDIHMVGMEYRPLEGGF